MGERTYSEQEMASMLERAAKLQANAARNAKNQPGLTLSELEMIAAESGLDPIHLRQAAAEMYDPGVSISHRNNSTNATHNFVDQWIVSELTDEAWEEIVAELRHRYDSDLGMMMGGGSLYGTGQVSQIGRTKEWKHMSMSGIETRVMVQPRGESIQLKLSQRVGWGGTLAESISYGTILAGLTALISGAATDSGLIGVAVLLGTLAIAVPLIHYADTKWRQKKHKELEELSDRLTGILSSHAPERVEPEIVAEPEMTYEDSESSRIDAALLEQEEPENLERDQQGNRRRER